MESKAGHQFTRTLRYKTPFHSRFMTRQDLFLDLQDSRRRWGKQHSPRKTWIASWTNFMGTALKTPLRLAPVHERCAWTAHYQTQFWTPSWIFLFKCCSSLSAAGAYCIDLLKSRIGSLKLSCTYWRLTFWHSRLVNAVVYLSARGSRSDITGRWAQSFSRPLEAMAMTERATEN